MTKDIAGDNRNIYQRIHAAMSEVTYVQKNKPSGMKYSIVSHDDVTAKVRPALIKQGVIYFPTVLEHGQDDSRTWARVETRFQNIDDREDFVSIRMFGYGIDSQDKGPGKAISYAVKYCLLKALGLETGDDPDYDNIEHQPPKTKKDFITEIKNTITDLGLNGKNVDETCKLLYNVSVKDAKLAVLEGLLESITNDPDAFRDPPKPTADPEKFECSACGRMLTPSAFDSPDGPCTECEAKGKEGSDQIPFDIA